MNSPSIVIGLGNTGTQYDRTRHNTGFAVLDRLAAHHGATWRTKTAHHADIAEYTIGDRRVILVKPTTYYNLAGQAAAAVTRFYKVPAANVLAIHDELALPLGTIRIRPSGSDAGNNGIKSLIQHLGPDFPRLRIGIATDELARQAASDFVLGTFTAEQQAIVDKITTQCLELVDRLAAAPHPISPTSIKIEG